MSEMPVDLPTPAPDTETDDFEERKNTGRCIVAIPTATEPIHHIGDVSEPKHMTVLWLGKPEENPDLDMDAVQEAVRGVAEGYGPLTGQVESSGPLGDEGADVAFLRGDGINEFRDDLLNDPALRTGVDAVEQHPGFTPHVTLGYDTEPVPEGDLPEEVIFDRVAVWDGDEHTEYPLGPSASSEENTDGAEVERERFEAELLTAMTEPITTFPPSMVLKDAATLAAACEWTERLTDHNTQLATRRVLMRRARSLGCQHVIPRDWLRQAVQSAQAVQVTTPDVPVVTVAPDLFQLKQQLSTLPDTALRTAYMRGVREFTMTAPNSRPPLPRDVIAQARVNSLIRLAQGDLSARTDDRDLLP
jgi:2'-5' RNA ligase superfamily